MAITVDFDYVFKNVYGAPIKEDQPDPDNPDDTVAKELTRFSRMSRVTTAMRRRSGGAWLCRCTTATTS